MLRVEKNWNPDERYDTFSSVGEPSLVFLCEKKFNFYQILSAIESFVILRIV